MQTAIIINKNALLIRSMLQEYNNLLLLVTHSHTHVIFLQFYNYYLIKNIKIKNKKCLKLHEKQNTEKNGYLLK